MRVVVVLGYSDGHREELHPICVARLERAAAVAVDADTIVFSGLPEAELMKSAWTGPTARLICESRARITAENAARVAQLVGELGVREVVVVTSWWHRLRAWLLFRALLRGVRLRVATVGGPWSPRLLLRELVLLPLAPFQLALARRRSRPRS